MTRNRTAETSTAQGQAPRRHSRTLRRRKVTHFLALALLGVLFAQLLAAAVTLSATVDVGFHITSGYEYLRTGKVRLFDEHPPLAKALFAWPLLFVPDLAAPETAPHYAEGDLIAVAQETTLAYRPLDRVIVAPRIAASLLTILLAASIYGFAKAWTGPVPGLLALTLCALDPNFIAHGNLATTDMAAAAFSFWAIWAGSRWLHQPTRGRWWTAAALLGMAQGAKLTALLIYPVLGIAVLLRPTDSEKDRSKEIGRRILSYAGMVGMSLLFLWGLYGFEVRPVTAIFGGSVPLPAASHIERWLRLRENLAYGRESFLLGQNSMDGWPLYFPVAFLVKTPLPVLILCTWSLGSMMWAGFTRAKRSGGVWTAARHYLLSGVAAPMFLFPLLYAAASLTSPLNIGYRHLLPVLPFLYLGAGGWRLPAVHFGSRPTARKVTRGRVAALSVLLLCLWLAANAVTTAPHYLAFFNELTGSPGQGWRYLADSNTDWGQTFKALASYQKKADVPPVKLSSFTFYDPAAYGVSYEPIAPMRDAAPVLPRRFNPAPGIYAISATTLDGVPLPYPSTYDWFRHREPFAKIGQAMFLYKVAPLPGKWIAQCTKPVAPLPDEAIDEGFGAPAARHLAFDCDQSWVLPTGGASLGWYVRAIPEQTRLRWPTSDTVRADLLPAWVGALSVDGLALSYVQPRDGALPAFAVWTATGGHDVTQPAAELSDTVAFLGLSAPDTIKAGATLDVVTWWEVLSPPARPISMKLHLRDAGGTTIAVGDGLGFPVEQWQAGDRFAQRHRIVVPPETPSGRYSLVTGAYWLDDLQPLPSQELTTEIEIR